MPRCHRRLCEANWNARHKKVRRNPLVTKKRNQTPCLEPGVFKDIFLTCSLPSHIHWVPSGFSDILNKAWTRCKNPTISNSQLPILQPCRNQFAMPIHESFRALVVTNTRLDPSSANARLKSKQYVPSTDSTLSKWSQGSISKQNITIIKANQQGPRVDYKILHTLLTNPKNRKFHTVLDGILVLNYLWGACLPIVLRHQRFLHLEERKRQYGPAVPLRSLVAWNSSKKQTKSGDEHD